MENIILIVILAAIAGGIIAFLLRAKKRGQTCIGCAHGGKCTGHCQSVCNRQQ